MADHLRLRRHSAAGPLEQDARLGGRLLEEARLRWGIEHLDQIRFAVLERDGSISIVPPAVPWANLGVSAEGAGR